jgi:hypothetical protein
MKNCFLIIINISFLLNPKNNFLGEMMQIAGVDVKKAAVFGFIIFWVFFFMGLAIRQITKRDIL